MTRQIRRSCRYELIKEIRTSAHSKTTTKNYQESRKCNFYEGPPANKIRSNVEDPEYSEDIVDRLGYAAYRTKEKKIWV